MKIRKMFIPSWKLLVERKRLCTDKKCDFLSTILKFIHSILWLALVFGRLTKLGWREMIALRK